MQFTEFEKAFRASIPVGTIFYNPGGGTSHILSYTDSKVCYLRGKSRIYVQLRDLYSAYKQFCGGQMSSADLRTFKPVVFDSAARPGGHSCNCTFLFLSLEQLGLVDRIYGEGVSGNPFFVILD